MAHRQLAEKYAKQLNDANQRIMVLETAVADGEDRLAQAKCTKNPTTEPQVNAVTLPQQQVTAATQMIDKLVNAVTVKNDELRTLTDRANAEGASATATVLKLQEDLRVARKMYVDIGIKDRTYARSIQAEKQTVEQRLQELMQAHEKLTQQNNKLPQQNDVLARNKWEPGNAVNQQGRAPNEAQEELKTAVKDRGNLRGQVTKLKTSQAQLRKELATLRRANTAKDEQGGAVKSDELATLQRSLDLERKRRQEAEILLGPDGKRCKKCNPIVVDLEADDDEGLPTASQAMEVDGDNNNFWSVV